MTDLYELGFVTATVVVLWITLSPLYYYFLHPLAHVKGPVLASTMPVWLIRKVAGCRLNRDMKKLHEEYGPVVRIGHNELSFASEQAMKDILNSGSPAHFTKKGTFEDLLLTMVYAAPNLITVKDHAEHKRLRMALQPAFTAKALLDQEETIQFHVQKLIDRLSSAQPHDTIKLTREMNKLMWGVVGHLCFGEPVPEAQLEYHEKAKKFHMKIAPLVEFFQYLNSASPIIGWLVKFSLATFRRNASRVKIVLGMGHLQKHVAHQNEHKTFLMAILGAKESQGLSWEEVLSNMMMLLMGGYDSMAVTSSAIFYHLLTRPDIYKQLQQELRQEYPPSSSDSTMTGNSLQRQPLLNAIINETLRLVPPLNGRRTHRVTTATTTVDGVRVPRGTQVSADAYTMQRDARCWARAEEWLPERWILADGYGGDVRTSWRPFSLGPRACMGRDLALQALRLAVARVVYAFDLEWVNEGFVWDRDTGSDFVWHDYDIVVKVSGKA